MTLLRSILIGEIILFLSWMVIEGVYTSSLIGCLVGVLVLALFIIFMPPQATAAGRRTKTLLIIADVVAISFFIMELSYAVTQDKSTAKLPLPYSKLQYVGYFLLYLSIVCLFLGAIGLLVSGLFKRKQPN